MSAVWSTFHIEPENAHTYMYVHTSKKTKSEPEGHFAAAQVSFNRKAYTRSRKAANTSCAQELQA